MQSQRLAGGTDGVRRRTTPPPCARCTVPRPRGLTRSSEWRPACGPPACAGCSERPSLAAPASGRRWPSRPGRHTRRPGPGRRPPGVRRGWPGRRGRSSGTGGREPPGRPPGPTSSAPGQDRGLGRRSPRTPACVTTRLMLATTPMVSPRAAAATSPERATGKPATGKGDGGERARRAGVPRNASPAAKTKNHSPIGSGSSKRAPSRRGRPGTGWLDSMRGPGKRARPDSARPEGAATSGSGAAKTGPRPTNPGPDQHGR